MGGHLIKSWSSSQTTSALSSGEAELYALTKSACQVKGLMSLAADFGMKIDATVRTDSTAAMGIIHRTDLGGRTRHVNLQYLWLKDCVHTDNLKMQEVKKEHNLADLLTKNLKKDVMDRHMTSMGLHPISGWAESASKLNLVSSEQGRDEWIERGGTGVGGPCATAPRGQSSAVWVRLHHTFRSNLFLPMNVAG